MKINYHRGERRALCGRKSGPMTTRLKSRRNSFKLWKKLAGRKLRREQKQALLRGRPFPRPRKSIWWEWI